MTQVKGEDGIERNVRVIDSQTMKELTSTLSQMVPNAAGTIPQAKPQEKEMVIIQMISMMDKLN